MATTLTRNLKLRINSNLTADSKYNLERIDTLGATFLVDSTDQLDIRSIGDISIEPESADIGGSGVGGALSIGNSSHSLDSISLYAATVQLSSPLSLLDQASGGDKYLAIRYKSDLSGPVDTTANRTLSIDLDGSNRSLVLGGNLSTSGGNATLTLTGTTNVTLPLTGTLATLAGVESLTNKGMVQVTDRFRLNNGTWNTDILQAASGQGSDLTFRLPPNDGSSGQVLTTDGTGVLSWTTGGGGGGSGDVLGFGGNWLNADGTSKLITHSLGSTDVDVEVIDLDIDEIIHVESVVVTDANNITLTASEAPATTWRVIVQAKP